MTWSKIEHNPYNIIFTAKFNDSSILITIFSWDYFNLLLAMLEYQPSLSSMANIALGGSANQIAVLTSN